MIEWKKFDESNPPVLNKEFLVFARSGFFKVAELEMWSDGEYVWTESQEQLTIHGVTHYAELNLPEEERK